MFSKHTDHFHFILNILRSKFYAVIKLV